jgi:hypothetical protein
MVELIVIVAILGTLAAIVISRSTWVEPPKRSLQRAFVEAVDMARSGVSIRFRVDKEENIGAIIPEILVRDEDTAENAWKAFKMRWEPTGKPWNFDPEIIYFSQDGICTPAKITWGTHLQREDYLLTVTGYLVENNSRF